MYKFLSKEPLHNPVASPTPTAKTEIKCTTCYMCACRCGIRVHLREGDNGPEVRYIDGNPAHPLNQGVICAKGSSGIMKQYSPARLTQPLLRKQGAERGAAEFEPISWERTFEILTERLGKIRATDPKKFALFTGRDQMQALTGLFARQFGTPNYAAHGGFCSVNMAAGMIYTIGGSFWEFGGPDLDHAKLFVMIGTAEDHHSNPMKIAISKFKRAGGKFISINPVRTGYSAIADEWIPIRPGTDGALFMALLHELIRTDNLDHAFLKRFTNAPQLVVLGEGAREGLFAFDPNPEKGPPGDGRNPHNKLVWDKTSGQILNAYPEGIAEGCDPALEGHYMLADGTRVTPSFQLLRDRVATCTPEWAEAITGIGADRIRQLAVEMGDTAFRQAFELPIPWTDAWGKQHPSTQARPVAFHAMRGLAAHSNGFQTVRALAILMSVLGTIDAPGGFRHKAPYPRHIVPNYRAFNDPGMIQPNTPLNAAPLGFPAHPDELAIYPDGSPIRIDHAFSWEHPLSAHGLMHNVITNAVKGDPYKIDTLMIFMANMAWNSTMNTLGVREMLNAKEESGEFKIPFLVVCDAFHSRDDGLRRPDPAGHHLPRAARRDVHARPADFRVRRPGRFGACAGAAALGRLQALPGSADRTRHAPQAAGLHHQGRRSASSATTPTSSSTGNRAGLRHRLPRRLARQGRREVAARRAEPEPVGDVQEEQLRLPLRPAQVLPVHAQLEQGLPRMVAAQPHHALRRADPDPPVFRGAAALPCRRAGQG
jgi:anaerobic selenocysteine-containing dehydrogenase